MNRRQPQYHSFSHNVISCDRTFFTVPWHDFSLALDRYAHPPLYLHVKEQTAGRGLSRGSQVQKLPRMAKIAVFDYADIVPIRLVG
jgi:hypothetical protein